MTTSRFPDFHLPTSIYVDNDILSHSADIFKGMGNRFLVIVTSTDLQLFSKPFGDFISSLKSSGINVIVYDDFPAQPTTEDIDPAVAFLQKTSCDAVIGFGGTGSISAARAVALLATNHFFCHDLLNDDSKKNPPLPVITVPAYPVYGFEIAPVFIIHEIEKMTGRFYFSYDLYPHATIIDPKISLTAGEEKSCRTGVASLALSTESVISRLNNDLVNTFALKSIDFIFRNLVNVYKELENPAHRAPVSTASLMSGIAFSSAQSSLTLCISLALSSLSHISLENAMCIILPHIMEYNLTTAPGKYVQMSKVMGEDVKEITVIEAAIKSVEAIRKLELDLEIPQRLSHFDIDKNSFRRVADLAMTYPFIEQGPRQMNSSEIETILIAAY